ncbi:MAG: hypothetical protein M3342_11180 [Bacteroidota bacterium]|nr:hypothetical protein [Bacteroidota bacterium]
MQLNFRTLSVLVLTALTIGTSCKKESTPKTDDPATEMAAQSDDEYQVAGETDAITNDINLIIESNVSLSGRMQNPTSLICDAAITAEETNGLRKMTITYNGSDCAGSRTRSGTVVFSLPSGVYWKTAGAALTVDFQNVTITRQSDHKSITLNGTFTITNVSGGRLTDLLTQSSIIHTLNSNQLSITFSDGTQRTWQIARKREYTYNSGLAITVTGTHTNGANTNIAEWGTNRFGIAFTTSITLPLVFRQDCNFRLTSGQVRHDRQGASATVTFGLNAEGNAISCPGSGSYYYKLSWTGIGGNTHSVILPY